MTPWAFAVVALAAYRLCRLLGWDDLPPVARARARLLGERVEPRCPACGAGRADYERRADHEWVGLAECPNCGSANGAEFETRYERPTLADLFHCPFCLGAWTSLGCYLAWLAAPHAALLALTPLAISGVVGLVAKNLDP